MRDRTDGTSAVFRPISSSPGQLAARFRPPAPAERRQGWLGKLIHRRRVTTYQRCLAVHIHYAGPRSALS
jgi:hypothetical protein